MWNQPEGRDGIAAARQGLRILVVDDHAGTQRAVQLVLRWLNCQSDVADNGRAALEAVRAREYDIILMDVVMPIMDGLEATRRIRLERPSGPGPRIVGMSADTMAEDQQVCFSAGMDDFLAKPVDVDALIRILDETALGPNALRSIPPLQTLSAALRCCEGAQGQV